LPQSKGTYRISVSWDLSDMPAGSRGVWSFGEGDATTEGPVDLLADSYYAAGPLESHPADGGSKRSTPGRRATTPTLIGR
jgi:hypothetical protein